jgi:hypothetical protein
MPDSSAAGRGAGGWRLAAALLACLVTAGAVRSSAWGEYGHVISGKAAALTLPPEMPAFFRQHADQLGYLTAEPDRWRDARESTGDPALADAFNPDHAINFERVPPGALEAPNRFEFLAALQRSGLTAAVGMAPYRSLEMFQRLRLQFRHWRATSDRRTRAWIEQRILNDAGLLGHYVTDGANPLHTSIHHHGWQGDNPEGFTTDTDIHGRFESQFVKAHVTLAELLAQSDRRPTVLGRGRADIFDYFRASHAQIAALYRIEKRTPFNDRTTDASAERFVVERLAFGVRMLRDLWWTAWVTSASPDRSEWR